MTTQTHTFAPSWKAYKIFIALIPLAAIAFVAAFVLTRGQTLLIGVAIVLVALAIAFGYTWLYMKRSRVVVSNGKLTYYRAIGSKTLQLDDGFEGLLVVYEDTTGMGYVSSSIVPVLFMANRKTGVRVRIHGAYYTLDTLQQIAALTASPDLTSPEALRGAIKKFSWNSTTATTKVLAKSHPFFFPWRERHPAGFIGIFVSVGVVVFAAGIIIAASIISPGSVPGLYW